MAKFDPFLSLDCARVEGVGAHSKVRKGSNFAALRSGAIVQKPEGPNTYDLKIRLSPSGNRACYCHSYSVWDQQCKSLAELRRGPCPHFADWSFLHQVAPCSQILWMSPALWWGRFWCVAEIFLEVKPPTGLVSPVLLSPCRLKLCVPEGVGQLDSFLDNMLTICFMLTDQQQPKKQQPTIMFCHSQRTNTSKGCWLCVKIWCHQF